MFSQPSRPKPGFPPGRLSSDMWTGHLGNGNGRLSQAGGSWVPVQHLPWNYQRGHRYGKQGLRPAGLTCPVLLTPFPLLRGQTTNCCLWGAQSSVTGSYPRVTTSLSQEDTQECLQAGAAMNWLKQTPRFHSVFVVSYNITAAHLPSPSQS